MLSEPDASGSLLSGQRRAVESLKATLFGDDPLVRRRYIQDFHREFSSHRRRLTAAAVERACGRADIVFVGDYHALPSCQNFAAGLLAALARSRPLTLFLEMVFSRDQKLLDDCVARRISEEEFRRRIRYERDWGYPWDGYGRLIAAARAAGASVVAADAPPRGGLRMIRKRDRHAASTIVERLLAEPGSRALVLFGESHMASRHLPGEVHKELARRGAKRSSVVVVQNVEEIYWETARAAAGAAEAVELGARRFCVFNASPLAKYEAYRQTLLGWSQQAEEEPDFGPSVHNLIDLLAARLGIDAYRYRVASPDGRRVPLVDLYPEVHARRERRRRPEPRRALARRLGRPGVVYRRGPNRVDVHSFSLASAGDAAARFMMAALRGEVGRPGGGRDRPRPGPGEGSALGRSATPASGGSLPFAGTILDEAFVAFSVLFLDPGVPAEAGRGEDLSSTPAGKGRGRKETLHRLLDAAAGAIRPDRGRARTSAPRGAAGLGERLGAAIYARVRNRPSGARTKRWLIEAARFPGGGGKTAKAARLLGEAAACAGWKR